MPERTNIYFDFEFIDDGREIVPISLGMCTDLGTEHEFYTEYEFDQSRANDWVRENVFPHLTNAYFPGAGGTVGKIGVTRAAAAEEIVGWVKHVCGDTKPMFWGYYPSYDWVCLCQHWGTMMQGPKGWPIRPECLMQMADQLGVDKADFPAQPKNAHNALADAKWNRELHDHIYKQWEANSP